MYTKHNNRLPNSTRRVVQVKYGFFPAERGTQHSIIGDRRKTAAKLRDTLRASPI